MMMGNIETIRTRTGNEFTYIRNKLLKRGYKIFEIPNSDKTKFSYYTAISEMPEVSPKFTVGIRIDIDNKIIDYAYEQGENRGESTWRFKNNINLF